MKIVKGINDLATVNPDLASEWHPIKNIGLTDKYGRDISAPNKISAGSEKKVWWMCEHGHEWQAPVYSRNNGRACPYCAKKLPVKGETDLQTLRPELAAQWHPIKNGDLKPSDVGIYSRKKVWWECENCGRIWEDTIRHRTEGSGCPHCKRKKFTIGVNDLASANPELAAQWHPTKNGDLKSTDVAVGSGKKVWWKCSKGHEWQSAISNRNSGTDCPHCTGRLPIFGETDLTTTYPRLISEWNYERNGGLKPTDVSAGSCKRVWWKCEHGHEWEAMIVTRTSGSGCPYCAGKLPIIGETDLATTHPELATQWHPTKNKKLNPTDVKAGSKKEVWWQCEKGHEWIAKISNRSNGSGCPYCSGNKVAVGETDLATTHPELATQWHPAKNGNLMPINVTAGSNKKVWWQCEKGHEWESTIANRTYGESCPYCSGRRLLVGENDLLTTRPDLASEWHPTKNGTLKPTDITKGSRRKIWWQCEKGHEWLARASSRAHGNNCPHCSESKGEKEIRKVLEDNHVSFKTQYKFKDRFMDSVNAKLKDDFALIDKYGNVIGTIEYYGQQHYELVDFAGKGLEFAEKEFEKTKKRDATKTKYLQEHGIPQLIIPYWEFDNIEYHTTEFIKKLSTKHELY